PQSKLIFLKTEINPYRELSPDEDRRIKEEGLLPLYPVFRGQQIDSRAFFKGALLTPAKELGALAVDFLLMGSNQESLFAYEPKSQTFQSIQELPFLAPQVATMWDVFNLREAYVDQFHSSDAEIAGAAYGAFALQVAETVAGVPSIAISRMPPDSFVFAG